MTNRPMKDSGVEAIGEIPEQWEVVKLKHKYKFDTGFTPSTKNDEYYDDINGFPWATISDLTKESNLKDTQKKISKDYVSKFKPSIVKKGSLLYSFKLSVGTTGFAGVDLYTNEAIASFYREDLESNKYLYYSSMFIESNSNENIYGAKILNQELIKNAKLPFPPLEEQQKIASFLDGKVAHIDSILEDTKQSIKNLKAYKQSLITEVVTKGLDPNVEVEDSGIEYIGKIPSHWKCGKLKYLLTSPLKYGANEIGLSYDENKPRYIRITDILEGNKLTNDNKQSLNEDVAKEYLLKSGDILFARSGATAGKSYLVTNETPRSAFAGYLIKGSFSNEKISEYVYYYTLSKSYEEWKNSIVIQATIQNIGAEKYSNMFIPIPPKDELDDLLDQLNKKNKIIDTTLENKKKLITQFETYKKSLIYEYVTGKKEVK